jgi:hypothetical protein
VSGLPFAPDFAPNEDTMKNLFPALKRGGYSIRVRFPDEGRGERFFDTRWCVSLTHAAGTFRIDCEVDYQGWTVHDRPAAPTLGQALRVGDRVVIAIDRHTCRGCRPLPGRAVTVTGVQTTDGGGVVLTYTL